MEEDIFLKKMRGVKPFKKDKEFVSNKNSKKNKIKKEDKKENIYIEKIKSENKKINSDFVLSFGDLNKDLKKGKIKIDRRLDFHGFSLLDAYDKFKDEVIKNYNKNNRCLLIITGKGIHKKSDNLDKDQPKLYYGRIKNSIIDWINEEGLKKYILTFQDAGIEHGGDGAIFVYLRKKKV